MITTCHLYRYLYTNHCTLVHGVTCVMCIHKDASFVCTNDTYAPCNHVQRIQVTLEYKTHNAIRCKHVCTRHLSCVVWRVRNDLRTRHLCKQQDKSFVQTMRHILIHVCHRATIQGTPCNNMQTIHSGRDVSKYVLMFAQMTCAQVILHTSHHKWLVIVRRSLCTRHATNDFVICGVTCAQDAMCASHVCKSHTSLVQTTIQGTCANINKVWRAQGTPCNNVQRIHVICANNNTSHTMQQHANNTRW